MCKTDRIATCGRDSKVIAPIKRGNVFWVSNKANPDFKNNNEDGLHPYIIIQDHYRAIDRGIACFIMDSKPYNTNNVPIAMNGKISYIDVYKIYYIKNYFFSAQNFLGSIAGTEVLNLCTKMFANSLAINPGVTWEEIERDYIGYLDRFYTENDNLCKTMMGQQGPVKDLRYTYGIKISFIPETEPDLYVPKFVLDKEGSKEKDFVKVMKEVKQKVMPLPQVTIADDPNERASTVYRSEHKEATTNLGDIFKGMNLELEDYLQVQVPITKEPEKKQEVVETVTTVEVINKPAATVTVPMPVAPKKPAEELVVNPVQRIQPPFISEREPITVNMNLMRNKAVSKRWEINPSIIEVPSSLEKMDIHDLEVLLFTVRKNGIHYVADMLDMKYSTLWARLNYLKKKHEVNYINDGCC